MIFRLSQKLNAKIKGGPLEAVPLEDNALADWSASVFMVERKQYVIVCNTKSLYGTVMAGNGITNGRQFNQQALASIRAVMEGDGYGAAYQRLVAPFCGSIVYGKALSRSVIGSMNDLIFQAQVRLEHFHLRHSE